MYACMHYVRVEVWIYIYIHTYVQIHTDIQTCSWARPVVAEAWPLSASSASFPRFSSKYLSFKCVACVCACVCLCVYIFEYVFVKYMYTDTCTSTQHMHTSMHIFDVSLVVLRLYYTFTWDQSAAETTTTPALMAVFGTVSDKGCTPATPWSHIYAMVYYR